YRVSHADFRIPDTELLVVEFEGGAAAHLFITWGADLAIYDVKANDRERIDVNYVVTTAGWLVRFETREGRPMILATKDGRIRLYPVETPPLTLYDRYLAARGAGRRVAPSAQDACCDIELAPFATANPTARRLPAPSAAGRT